MNYFSSDPNETPLSQPSDIQVEQKYLVMIGTLNYPASRAHTFRMPDKTYCFPFPLASVVHQWPLTRLSVPISPFLSQFKGEKRNVHSHSSKQHWKTAFQCHCAWIVPEHGVRAGELCPFTPIPGYASADMTCEADIYNEVDGYSSSLIWVLLYSENCCTHGVSTGTNSWVRVRVRVPTHEYGYEYGYKVMSTGTGESPDLWVRVRVRVPRDEYGYGYEYGNLYSSTGTSTGTGTGTTRLLITNVTGLYT